MMMETKKPTYQKEDAERAKVNAIKEVKEEESEIKDDECD